MIEGQNGTMAKLREMLHQSQLGQLHVREGLRAEGRAGAPWVAQFSQALRTFLHVIVIRILLFSGLRGRCPKSATGSPA